MAYTESLERFFDQPVVDFNDEPDWQGPDAAYRLRQEYDDERSLSDRLNALLMVPESSELRALVIGTWNEVWEGGDSSGIVGELVQRADRLPNLRAVFLGDITFEECELSWINQSNISPLLTAYPQLDELRIRGSNGLSIPRVAHASLRTLAIESGGLPRDVLRGLFTCDFPSLERLALLFGEPNYGFDGSVEDLQPLLAGDPFPRLKHLGLMNAEIANDIAAVIVNSPVVERLETLDLSMGNLNDEGAKSLRELAPHRNLKQLILSYHYISEQALRDLRASLDCEVIAEDPQSPDDEWRPILHAE